MATESLKIALIYELREAYKALGYSNADCDRFEVGEAAEHIAAALKNLGHEVVLVPDIHSLVKRLAHGEGSTWDLAFNTTEGLHGLAREGQVPALLEAYQIPFTFSDAATMTLCLDKGRTKMVLEHFNVPTAPFAVIHFDHTAEKTQVSLDEILSMIRMSRHSETLLSQYPLFVKPLAEGSSKGIGATNKIKSIESLCDVVNSLRDSSPSSLGVLVEKYLPGREFTVGILGTGEDAWVVGVDEIYGASADDWAGEADEIKIGWDDQEADLACQTALRAWTVLRCRDGGRIDIRMDHSGSPVAHVMEINPLAGLLPHWSQLPMIAEHNNVSYNELIEYILKSALQRRRGRVLN
ncbi:D-alanine--D-alanine ligase family protein [Aspergillus niger CBS 101883]|uniref:D-alanine--D-alanine ligase family protein n=1 Tax=Aspergillus lacticoffeatus (strain CBS 101883) TaxID=1450533 RepID=UPI0001F265D7|nr:D-alanine--D-alanine ligase [Aspergillus niger CBS 513.88]XP_025451873.1 D-alanine--D-alanine ligase [Aspergillus niger CBS 101883]PYH53818.1 D-alanine--D-alanine ligase [Aspergillus niger CBS 101883]|eukprot:XP_001400807.2 D-alanine--D-alanine ligase [Aspergillus niger CBS 513.88]